MTFIIQTPKGERKIGPGEPCFIIAEMSANHGQDYDKAVSIIKAAAEAGADAIKLQTYTADTITLDSDNEYFVIENKENPGSWQKKKLYDLYKKAHTPWEWHKELKKVAEEYGLVFFSTPFDETAVDFLEELEVPLYKIASYEATHIPLLKKIAQTGKPVIMSVGFAVEEEIDLAVKTLRTNGADNIALLHCVTAYSKKPILEESNLQTLLALGKKYSVVCGFSDNNAGIKIPLQAVMMGASIVEKHIVADDNDQTFDADFSINGAQFKNFVDAVRDAEKAIGKVKFGPQSEKERQNTKYRRSIFVARPIKSGEEFTQENIRVVRPSYGLAPKHYEDVLGKKANTDLEFGTPVTWDVVEEHSSS